MPRARNALISLVAFLLPLAAQAAESEAPDPPALTSIEGYLYAQRYAGTHQGIDSTGYTAGGYVQLEWTRTKGEALSFGLASEIAAGLGEFDSDVAIELTADLLGGVGRYKINQDNEVGLFYEPIEIFATPVGGFIGSKLALRYRFKRLQLEVARGGNGFGYGWLVPKDGGATVLASLQYLMPGHSTFGLRFLRTAVSPSSAYAIMLFWGGWE
jgi:hypothetical protein